MFIDDSAFPLIRYRFSPKLSQDEVDEAVAACARVFERGKRVAFVIDLSELEDALSAQRREHFAKLMATIQKDADRLMLGAVYVAPSIISRGVIIALNWIRGKRPYPVVVVASEAEADAIARSWLAGS